MEVKTYELSPNLQNAADIAEWTEIAGRIGLTEQLKKLQTTQAFPVLSAKELAVYRAICPSQTKIEEFKTEIIPLQVLKVVELAKTMFTKIYVWHPEEADHDPFVVGRNDDSHWRQDGWYLIARWGEELLDLPSLQKRARTKLLMTQKAKLEERYHDAKKNMELMVGNIDAHLEGTTGLY